MGEATLAAAGGVPRPMTVEPVQDTGNFPEVVAAASAAAPPSMPIVTVGNDMAMPATSSPLATAATGTVPHGVKRTREDDDREWR